MKILCTLLFAQNMWKIIWYMEYLFNSKRCTIENSILLKRD